jgi:hypothetical protein
MKRLAQIDLRGDEMIVLSYSRTKPGFWVMNGKYVRLRANVADDDLGRAVERALSATEHDIPPPSQDDPLPAAPVLKELGLKSYSSYMKGVRSVQVERENSNVSVVPTRNEGSHGGFVELLDQTEQLESPTSRKLGAAVRRALARSS